MKLISMTEFVLEQEQPTYLQKEEFEDVFYKIHNYANFLKQPLKLSMFIPCDEFGNVLIKPEEHLENRSLYFKELEIYQKAKERVFIQRI